MHSEKGGDELSERYWTRMRRELVDWFAERAPFLVDGYKGAVHLLHMPGFPGRVHFICHAVRDIYKEVPAALGLPRSIQPGDVYPQLQRDLAEAWRQEPPQAMDTQEGEAEAYRIGERLKRRAQAIVEQVVSFAQEPSLGGRLATALFRSSNRAANEYLPMGLSLALKREHKYFVGLAHLSGTSRSLPSDAELVGRFETFERGFHALVGPYFSGKEELDAILDAANRQTD